MNENNPSHSSKRILIWTASFPPILGGLQTVTQQLAVGLHERGCDVLVLTNRSSRSLSARENSSDGFTIRRYRHWQTGLNPQSPRNLLSSSAGSLLFPFQQHRINQMISSYEPDIVNIHFPNIQNCYAEKLWPLLKHTRWMVSLHGHDILQWYETNGEDYTYSRIKPLRVFEADQFTRQKWVLERCDSVTACSGWLAEKAIRLFPFVEPKIKVIYNGVDIKRFNISADMPIEPYIFAFGRLDTHKGFDLLIKAFSSVIKSFPGLSLSIAGTGPAKESLNRLATELQVDKYINWLGHLSQDTIAEYCLKASLIVIPSRREPFGISVLEALASGRPVVATNVGGIPEIAKYFDLNLTSAKVEGIAEEMFRILHQDIERNRNQDRNSFERFSITSMIQRYENTLIP